MRPNEDANLLIHFLNAVLGSTLPALIRQVELLNSYNEREFLDDKLSIVNVKARDEHGRLYQVEIQLLNHPDLPARILYTWADLYSAQLQSGQDYGALRPTHAIWLLVEGLLADDPAYAHVYQFRAAAGRTFLDHGGIWLLELNKFAAERVETEQERWLRFFQEGERLDETRLPDWMQTDEMRQAMSTLTAFSEKERAYHAYQARQNYLREQRSIQRYLETLQAQTETLQAQAEQERAAKEAALREKDAALAEIARLKALLHDS